MENPFFTLFETDAEFKKHVKHEIINVKSNTLIIQENEPNLHIYLIMSGGVRVTTKTEVVGEKAMSPGLCDLGKGDTVGEFCLIDDEPASATVNTIEDSKLIKIEGKSLNDFISSHPNRGVLILRFLINRLVLRVRQSGNAVKKLLVWGIKTHKLDQHM